MQPSKPNDYTKQTDQKNGSMTTVNGQTSPDKVSHLVSTSTHYTIIIICMFVYPFTSILPDWWDVVTRLIFQHATVALYCNLRNILGSQLDRKFYLCPDSLQLWYHV